MNHANSPSTAIEISASSWLNTDAAIDLSSLKGQVVVIVTFQMLCPGCVSHCLPQASKIHQLYGDQGIQVIGLHTVFEHHAAMGETSLKAFLHEYGIKFPVAIDQASDHSDIPQTMARLGLRGTPTTIVLDAKGEVRLNHFGQVPDLVLGEMLGQLRHEASTLEAQQSVPSRPSKSAPNQQTEATPSDNKCADGVCEV